MSKSTKQEVLNKIDDIERKLPNGELEKIKINTKFIKDSLNRYKRVW